MMHPDVKAERQMYDEEIRGLLKEIGGDSPDEEYFKFLERRLFEDRYVLDKVLANVPSTEALFGLKQTYEQKKQKGEISNSLAFPAWWFPSIMETLKIKEMLPFAFYVKK